jgi:Flp pilus assembly protein TadG
MPLQQFIRSTRGASAVEFALLSPLFILLLMGMAAYGIYFGAAHSVQQIAADAARSAIAGLTESERKSIVTSFVARNAGGYPFIDPARIVVDTHDSRADGNQFVVAIAYDASRLPIWYLTSSLSMPGMTIRRESTIRVGGI